MAEKKTFIGKALAGLKNSRTRTADLEAKSERVVSIPAVAVFTELPFAPAGTIGGDEGKFPPPDIQKDFQPAVKKASVRKTTKKRAKKVSPAKKASKRKTKIK